MKNKKLLMILFLLLFGFNATNVNAEALCKRATTLHTDECSAAKCKDKGYTLDGSKKTTIIEYGNLNDSNKLVLGDAFDCDVNGDGIYDSEKERFYYLTDRSYLGDINESVGVFIYYTNVTTGNPDLGNKVYPWDAEVDYSTRADNITLPYFPRSAVKQLPTKEQWKNIKLYNEKRMIMDNEGKISNVHENYDIEGNIYYREYAARLLSIEEYKNACLPGVTENKTLYSLPDNCNFLLEKTDYSSNNYRGYWLETPIDVKSNDGFALLIGYGKVQNTEVSFIGDDGVGVRPVIEVPKSRVDLSVQKVDSSNDTNKSNTPNNENTQVVQVEDTGLSVVAVLILVGLIVFGFGMFIIYNSIKSTKGNA